MRRHKAEGASGGFGGDWSDSGTFLRKPASGWLHEDTELMDNSCINYEVEYLGSIGVSQSMRTLQFSVRTQVTKEAILRLAEGAGKVYFGKKRKVAKQINKLLGAADTRQAGSLNLSISVEHLKINDSGGAVLIRHSLPSISFASGGDGPTVDFIGYVAKDPVHGRACHVFECRESSQYVLTTIGQAFELRYKLYLKTPRPNVHPVEVEDTWGQDAWGSQRNHRSEPEPHSYTTSVEVHSPGTTPLSPLTTPPPLPPPLNTNIYDDVPPTPPPPVPESRPRVYSNLPGFPVEEEEETCGSHGNKPPSSAPRFENPYDTMFVENSVGAAAVTSSRHHQPSEPPPKYSEVGVYSDPGEVTGEIPRTYSDPNYEDSGQLMTIRQIPSTVTGDTNDEIDLTPAPPINDYSNLGPNGEVLDEPPPTRKKPHPPKKPPRPPEMLNGSATLYDDAQSRVPLPQQNHYGNQPPRPQGSPDEDLYGNREVERVLELNERKRLASNEYEDAEVLDSMVAAATPPVVSHTPAGTYDNPDEIMESVGGARGVALGNARVHDQPPSRGGLREGVYDIAETNEADLYDDATSIEPQRSSQVPMSPKFDDVIYMKQGETPSPPLIHPKPATPPVPHVSSASAGVKPPPARKPAALRNIKALSTALPEPPAPLPRQKYFHGSISRIEAEALLEKDGQFLIRESSKRLGQYVLTGMANGQPQHLLLMDKEGRVKSKDHVFESIPHLVAYFTEKKVPLVIGGAQVFLNDCIVSISSYR